MRIYLLRHTEVENLIATTLRRKPGFHLSKKGNNQAHEVADFINKQNIFIKRIFSSPLERCRETAQIIRDKLNSKIQFEIKEYLNEWEKGEKSEDIALRMKLVLKEAQDRDLFVSHQDVIRVFINLLKDKPLLNLDLDCNLGTLYQIDFERDKEFVEVKLLFCS